MFGPFPSIPLIAMFQLDHLTKAARLMPSSKEITNRAEPAFIASKVLPQQAERWGHLKKHEDISTGSAMLSEEIK